MRWTIADNGECIQVADEEPPPISPVVYRHHTFILGRRCGRTMAASLMAVLYPEAVKAAIEDEERRLRERVLASIEGPKRPRFLL